MKRGLIWTALLEAKGQPDGDYAETESAYVRGVVIAQSSDDAADLWKRGLDSMGFDLLSVDESRMITEEDQSHHEELHRLLVKAKRTRLPEFGAFNTWDNEDEE